MLKERRDSTSGGGDEKTKGAWYYTILYWKKVGGQYSSVMGHVLSIEGVSEAYEFFFTCGPPLSLVVYIRISLYKIDYMLCAYIKTPYIEGQWQKCLFS